VGATAIERGGERSARLLGTSRASRADPAGSECALYHARRVAERGSPGGRYPKKAMTLHIAHNPIALAR
jgi:hypothetical protein